MSDVSRKLHAKVNDLMVASVLTARPETTLAEVRRVLREKRVSCLPVIDGEEHPVGIVTTTDLLETHPDERTVGEIMARTVHTVPQYADVSQAARTMRKHRIHHLVVVHEKRVVGVLSSFDLLLLVEDRRFRARNAPPRPKHRRLSGGRREVDIHGRVDGVANDGGD